MSFSISSLSNYTNEWGVELVAKMLAQGQTAKNVTVQPGIKSAEYIPINSTTLALQAGAGAWSPGASTTNVTQRLLSVDAIDYQEAMAIQQAEAKSLQWMIKSGSKGDDISFAERFVGEKMANIGYINECLVWQGNKATGAGNMAFANGFLQNLTNTSASASTISTSGYSGFNSSNCVALVDHMRTIVPVHIKMKDNLKMFMGTDNFDTYAIALKNANNYFIDGNQDYSAYEMRLPGSNIKIIGTAGLDGTNKIVLGSAESFLIGCDNTTEMDSIDVWYSKDNRQIRIAASYKLGTTVLFPEFTIIHKQA